ncbi:MAG: hypothetical protein O2829_05410 [Bacteroidetes bacterium]|nr:hypothetical protein [Bacteroidota bacterium]MDA1268514.1 hypothetical protein [Bacteroidota bacterium]
MCTVEIINLPLRHAFALPVMGAVIQYLFGRITAESWTAIIQAQRDYFGAHTYQRKDDPTGKSYHTQWT